MTNYASLATAGAAPKKKGGDSGQKPAEKKPQKASKKPATEGDADVKKDTSLSDVKKAAADLASKLRDLTGFDETDEVDEHITNDGSRDISFELDGEKFGGFVESRSKGSLDVVVIHGSEYKAAKSLPSSDLTAVAAKIKELAKEMLGGDSTAETEEECECSEDVAKEDMLLPVKRDKDPDEDEEGEPAENASAGGSSSGAVASAPGRKSMRDLMDSLRRVSSE